MLKKPPDFGGLTHKIRKIAFSCFRCPVFAFLVSRITVATAGGGCGVGDQSSKNAKNPTVSAQ